MGSINIEVKRGIGVVHTYHDDGDELQDRHVTRPMEVIYIDGVEVAYKTVDVDNFDGTIKYNKAQPIMYSDEYYIVSICDFKATTEAEFFKEIDKFVSKRFQNKRKEFIKKTVPEYSENHMLTALDRCLFVFDNERYQKESEEFNEELKEFFDSLFEE